MNHNQNTLDAINRDCSPSSLLVIDRVGRLHRLFCPFPVQLIQDLPVGKYNDIVFVDKVLVSQDLVLLYQVKHQLFRYNLFIIIIS
jgi:hypothetical protein